MVFGAEPFPPRVTKANMLCLLADLSRHASMPTLHLLRHRSGIPTQLQLYPLWRSLHFVLRTRIESIFLADQRHTLRSFSPVFLRRIAVLAVPVFVELCQPGKLFSNK